MTKLKKSLSITALALASFCAAAAEPSDASVEKLLSLTQAESMTEAIYGHLEQSMRQGMRQGMEQAAAGQPLTDEQRRVLDAVPKKFVQVMRGELTWAMFKPMYIQIYKESFDQEDIDGLNAFYSSKAGQAYVNKMPIAIQKSMAAVQERMAPMIGKMPAIIKAAVDEAKLGK